MRHSMEKYLTILTIVAMLLLLSYATLQAQTPVPPTPVIMSGQSAIDALTQGAKADPANANRTLALIVKTVQSPSFKIFWDGAVKAGQELGYKEVLYRGAATQADIAGQVNLVNDMVSAHVAGIILIATDAKALVKPAEDAMAQGVPLVTIDSGIDSTKPFAYIATDNIAGAATAADELAKLIGGKGVVGDLGITAGSQTGIEREKGFVDEIKAKYPDIKVLPVQYTGCDPAQALNIASDEQTGNPTMAGFYGACDGPGAGAGQMIKQRSLKGQVHVVTFDATPELFNLFLDGYVDTLIIQDLYRVGYLGVYAMDKAVHGQAINPKNVAIPIVVVTRQNITDPKIYALMASYGTDIQKILDTRGIKPSGTMTTTTTTK
jgi:ribose transport system substrate-binding protein